MLKTRKPTPRETVFLVLLAGVALVSLYYLRGGGRGFGGTGDAGETVALPGDAPVVQLASLEREPGNYDPKGRDLFKYGQPPRVLRPKVPAPKPQPPRPRNQIPRTPKPTRQMPVDTGPRPPKPNFKYLGYLGPKDNRIAVFEAGENMVLARSGEVVQEKFRVLEFRYETIVMGYTDERFRDKTTELSVKR